MKFAGSWPRNLQLLAAGNICCRWDKSEFKEYFVFFMKNSKTCKKYVEVIWTGDVILIGWEWNTFTCKTIKLTKLTWSLKSANIVSCITFHVHIEIYLYLKKIYILLSKDSHASGNRWRKTSPNSPPTAKLNNSFNLFAAAKK